MDKELNSLQLNFGQHFDNIEKFAGLTENDDYVKKTGMMDIDTKFNHWF